MQSPQFFKGQTLTAEALNEISQNVRNLAAQVGRAGLASRYVGPSPLRPLVDSTGQPVYLSPADVGGSGGVYLRAPWVEDSLRLSTSAVLADPAALTRDGSESLKAGDEIFQKITVDSWGNTLSTELSVIASGVSLPTPSAWDPSTGTTGVLYRRLASVIADPRMAGSSVTGKNMPFRPAVVLHSDGSVPILPRNASADSGSVQLVGPLTGSTLPVKTLVAGQGVTLSDYASSVTLTATAETIPLAQFNTDTIDPETGQEAAAVPGKIRAVGFTVADEPSIQNGEILLPLAHDVESGSVMAVGALSTAAAVHDISRPQIMRGELQLPFASSGVPGLLSDVQVSEDGPSLVNGVLTIPSGGGGSQLTTIIYGGTETPYISGHTINHPFAEINDTGDAVSGVIRGIVTEDPSAVLPYFASGVLYVPPPSGGGGSQLTTIVYGGTETPYISGNTIKHPFAEINDTGDAVSGVIRGIVTEDPSAVLPYFASGVLFTPPPPSKGFYDVNGSSVLWQDMPTSFATALTLSYYYIGPYKTYLKAHSVNGFIKLTFQLDGSDEYA